MHEMKECKGCNKELPKSEFKKANGGHGYGSDTSAYCKNCSRLRINAATFFAKEKKMLKSEWVAAVPRSERQQLVESKFQEYLKNPPPCPRKLETFDITEKTCVGCGLTKMVDQFNASNNKSGRHKLCITCHRLRHKADTVASHRRGLSTRKYIHTVPRAERMAEITVILQELVRDYLKDPNHLILEPKTPRTPKTITRNKRTKRPHVAFKRVARYGEDFVPDSSLSARKKERRQALKQLGNKQVTDTKGYVYIISHPVHTGTKGYVSIGKAWDYESRLGSYNRSDPDCEYKLEFVKSFDNRHEAEDIIHSKLSAFRKDNTEWFKIPIKDAIEVLSNFDGQV